VNRNSSQITDDLLVKYLLGEATSEEAQHVQQWIAADAANKKEFDNFSLIWNESKKLQPPAVLTKMQHGKGFSNEWLPSKSHQKQ